MFSNYYIGLFTMLPVILLSLVIQILLKSTYAKFAAIGNSRRMNGAQMAETILHNAGIYDVSVECVQGHLSDHFDPTKKVVRLSPEVYNGTSIASIGIAAHECGHALQYNANYLPMKIRSGVVGITNFSSKLLYVLIIASLFLSGEFEFNPVFFNIVIICYAIMFFFQLITLPVEFNASSRAVAQIERFGFSEDDVKGVKCVLTSAALTYVAAAIHSLYQLLIIISRYRSRND